MNKMFTAVAMLQLVEVGKVVLERSDGQASSRLPEPGQRLASKVTVRHLLTHTGGTGDIFGPDFVREPPGAPRPTGTMSYLLRVAPASRFKPGCRASGNGNHGFVLLGALYRSSAAGASYYDDVREHVFRPGPGDELHGLAAGIGLRSRSGAGRLHWGSSGFAGRPNTDSDPPMEGHGRGRRSLDGR